MRKIRTSLLRCDPMQDEKACGLLQMEYTVPPEVLYSAYWYRSGTNQTMRNHLSEIAREAAQVCGKPDALADTIWCRIRNVRIRPEMLCGHRTLDSYQPGPLRIYP